mgnify:CR=1 FL=1
MWQWSAGRSLRRGTSPTDRHPRWVGHGRTFACYRGFDPERFCSWTIQKTSGEFAGYPVTIFFLVEDYPKKKDAPQEETWIVTTDLSLSPEEAREAAHLRWHIENNVLNQIRAGIKPTLKNLCSQLDEVLPPFFGRLLACSMINSFPARPSLCLTTGWEISEIHPPILTSSMKCVY